MHATVGVLLPQLGMFSVSLAFVRLVRLVRLVLGV
jgi:hypothetical protein